MQGLERWREQSLSHRKCVRSLKSAIGKRPSKFVLFIQVVNSEHEWDVSEFNSLWSILYDGMRGHFNPFLFS